MEWGGRLWWLALDTASASDLTWATITSLPTAAQAHHSEINPVPSGGAFDTVVEQVSEVALTNIVAYWLDESLR